MPATDDQLDTPFRRALLYVVQELGEVGVLKLEKILYLADLEYFHRSGRRITGARWVRQKLGPVAKSVVPSTKMMADHEIVVTREQVGPYGSDVYRPGPRPRFRPVLPADQRRVLDEIIELTRSLSGTQAKELTYRTIPMLARLSAEREVGHELLDEPLVFERTQAGTARIARRVPRAAPERRRAFKRAELSRVSDLVDATVARSGQ